jgi:hypothetical protein
VSMSGGERNVERSEVMVDFGREETKGDRSFVRVRIVLEDCGAEVDAYEGSQGYRRLGLGDGDARACAGVGELVDEDVVPERWTESFVKTTWFLHYTR